ncbi:MAG: hypothetical protein PWQ67_583 [Clostridia bacterium]|jgi:hypothetical protein|nr:hypothetical protein [Clostridia bacterium]MDN5322129.1 hypothetical protein [Clostridia bacterium]
MAKNYLIGGGLKMPDARNQKWEKVIKFYFNAEGEKEAGSQD